MLLIIIAICLFAAFAQQQSCNLCSDLLRQGCPDGNICCPNCTNTEVAAGICIGSTTVGSTPTCETCANKPVLDCPQPQPQPAPQPEPSPAPQPERQPEPAPQPGSEPQPSPAPGFCDSCSNVAPPTGKKCCPNCGSNQGTFMEVCPAIQCAAVPPPCPTTPCDTCNPAERNGCPLGFGCCGSSCIQVSANAPLSCATPDIVIPNPSVCDSSCESFRSCACNGGKYCLGKSEISCRLPTEPCPGSSTPPPPEPALNCSICPAANRGCPSSSYCCANPCSNDGVCKSSSDSCPVAECLVANPPCPEPCPTGSVRTKCSTGTICVPIGQLPPTPDSPCLTPPPPPEVPQPCDLCPDNVPTPRRCTNGTVCCAIGSGGCYKECPEEAAAVKCAPSPSPSPSPVSCNTASDCPAAGSKCCCGGDSTCLARKGYCSTTDCSPCPALSTADIKCPAPIPCSSSRPVNSAGLTNCPIDPCTSGTGRSFWDEKSCSCRTICPEPPQSGCPVNASCGDCLRSVNCVYLTAKTASGDTIGRCKISTNTQAESVLEKVSCPTSVTPIDPTGSPVLGGVVPEVIEDCLAAFYDSIKTSCRASISGISGNDEKANYVIQFTCVANFNLDDALKTALAKCLQVQVPNQTEHGFQVINQDQPIKKRQISGSSVQVTSSQPASSQPPSGLSGGAIAGIVIGSVAAALLVVAIVAAIFWKTHDDEGHI